MRKYKLDELPGLRNVLRGDMSFVGPASMKYSNEEEILGLQPDPMKYNEKSSIPTKCE